MNDENMLQSNVQTTLGRYRLLRKIGSGGMGDVWLAEDPVLRRQVAIKTLPVHSQRDNEYLQRFVREARAAATLNHPHILLVHDYGEQPLADGRSITYIVMPFVAGDTLSDQITTYNSRGMLMPRQEALSYLSQAAEAIDYAHTQGIIHRDIKPKNMLLREDHWLLLSDFGIARILTDQQHLTQTGVGFGTPEYMAPEQAQGKAVPASDIYSLAVIAYQLFSGRLPFTADTPYALTIQHIVSPPPPPRQFNPALPPAVEQVILQGLAKDPGQRPPSTQAFVTALQAAFAGMFVPDSKLPGLAPTVPVIPPLPETRPVISSETVDQPAKGMSRRTMLLGGAAFVLAGGGLGAWVIANHTGGSGPGKAQSTATATTTKKPASTPDPNGPALVLVGHTQPVSGLAWSPRASVLVSAGLDGRVLQWNISGIAPGTQIVTQPDVALRNVGSQPLLAWSSDASLLAIGNVYPPDGDLSHAYVSIYAGNLNGPAPGFPDPIALPNNNNVAALAWTPGNYCAMAVNSILNPSNSAATQFVFTGPTLHGQSTTPVTLQINLTGQSGFFPNTLAYATDATRLAAAAVEGAVIFSVTISGTTAHLRVLRTLQNIGQYTTEVDAVSWSPDEQYLAGMNVDTANSSGSTVVVWNLNNGTRRGLGLSNNGTVLQALAWSPAPASTRLAAGGQDGKVYVWDMNENTLPVRVLDGLSAAVQALAWSSDGRWLAAGYKDTNNSILLWKM
ncbi:MAG TPA: serine/threonine-protein kinase [Ktedonobacteraceae bacterium]|nr:serine/threonine-protein kinase [Ktedonobacteraceae bacterium]